jgi:hypothetical protein
MENLPPACAFFSIPLVTRASMHAPEFVQQAENIRSFDQGVIVIRQYAPRNSSGRMLPE